MANLVSFNEKHNEANGEGNRDGGNDNHSWNCGVEGWTDDEGIQGLRQRQIMNAMAMLLTCRGTPMLLMGDEIGRSQNGNNNAYCIDSAVSWLDWSLLQTNEDLHRVATSLIHFRHRHPALRVNSFDGHGSSLLPSCSFHGTKPWSPDWSSESKQLAWMMSVDVDQTKACESNRQVVDIVYVATNMAHYASWFELPEAPNGYTWKLYFNTGDQNVRNYDEGVALTDSGLLVGERSVIILCASSSGTGHP